MNFDASGDTLKGLFTATRTYNIPRFQREFSWDKSNNDELLDDLEKQIEYNTESGEFKFNKYYLGNMIFLGDKDADSVEVIDGQQRLTSGTILLAALRDTFRKFECDDEDLVENAKGFAETIQSEYLVKKIDRESVRKLNTKSSFPYFAETIQGEKNDTDYRPKTDEEIMLKETFDNFRNKLSLQNILKVLSNKKIIDNQKHSEQNYKLYILFLKAIRETFLRSNIVEIFVAEEKDAHKIFENINSKGKPLSQVDLIKNDLYSRIGKDDVGVDLTFQFWTDLTDTISGSSIDTDPNEFFLHFWKARYPKDNVNGKNLYSKYIKRFGNSSDEGLVDLTKCLTKYLKTYVDIMNTSKYINNQDLKGIAKSLNTINKLKVVQTRIPILALFVKRLEFKKFKDSELQEFLAYLSNFNLAAFGIVSIRANKTTNLYKNFCTEVNNSKDPSEVYKAMHQLCNKLSELVPKEEFINAFANLTTNSKLDSFPAYYAIKTIGNNLDNRKFDDDEYSIEHIIDKDEGSDITKNIGNLTVLEKKINNKLSEIKSNLGEKEYSIDFKKDLYKQSSYKMTNDFFAEYKKFDDTQIVTRAKNLANYFFKVFIER